MARYIIPAFGTYPEEGAIIGRLLAGYGEIELEINICLGQALQDENSALKAMYSMRSEDQRIRVADALMRPTYAKVGLGNEFADAIGAIRFCRKIRNQFAHCHWYDHKTNGLFFTNLEDATYGDDETTLSFRHIDVPLLQQQEDYYCYASDCFVFLHKEIGRLRGEVRVHPYLMPSKIPQPNLYNPLEEHPIRPLDIGPSSSIEQPPPSRA